MTQTLIIFAREPVAGRTKTRLCPPLDGATAAELYACFLADTLDNARRVPGARVLIAHTPESHPACFAEIAPDLVARPQRGATLGERMDQAFAEAFAERPDQAATTNGERVLREQPWPFVLGLLSVVIIGSDSPDLPAAYIGEAFDRLEGGADLVLGPSDDGGYYLIGLRAPQPALLREVPMSTPTVLADTLALARALHLRAELLPPWYDVDTAAELAQLAASLRAAPPTVAPRTRAFLASRRWQAEG